MSSVNRWTIKDNSNGISPVGFSGPMDSATIIRKCSDHLGRLAQGAMSGNLLLAFNPVANTATFTSASLGSETASDSCTVGGTTVLCTVSPSNGKATIAAGTAGTSVSKSNAAITTNGANLSFTVNINGDGPQTITVTGASGAAIASAIQTAIRALTAVNALNASALSTATCSYSATGGTGSTPQYTITSGVVGSGSSVVCAGYGAASLGFGLVNGGTEAVGTASTMDNMAAILNASAAMVNVCSFYVCGAVMTATCLIPGLIGNNLYSAVGSTGIALTHSFIASAAGTEGSQATFAMGM